MLVVKGRILATGLAAFALISCGGGTTGTSPTGVKFLGTAQDPSGAGVSNTSMTVSSSSSGQILVASSTDSGGRFEMTLPPSEVSLDIAVEGVAPLTVRRSIEESSAMFAALSVDAANQSALTAQVEARIVSSQCAGVSVTPLSVDASDFDPTEDPCEVAIEVATSDINVGSSDVVVSGRCGAQEVRSDLTQVESNGREVARIDLSSALKSDCRALAIEVRSNGNGAQAIQFEVKRPER